MRNHLKGPCRTLGLPLFLILIPAIAGAGCKALGLRSPGDTSPDFGGLNGGPTIELTELDELTRAFADRYVGLLASTCDALKKDNLDAVQRREAQALMLDCATNVYDIASNADAYTRMLDLVVVTTLVSQVWIDDDRAGEVFGDRGDLLVRALHHGRVEAWALAAQVLRPDQLELLDYTMWDWRQHNPDMVRMPFVRFSNFAIGRGKSATAEVLAAGGLFANVGKAGRSVDEARLLSERMFYQLKREGTLLRWQFEAAKDDLIATPEVSRYINDVNRLTAQAEQLPGIVAAEREALFSAIDDRTKAIDATLGRVTDASAHASGAATSIGAAGKSLNDMLATAASLLGQYDKMHWSPSPSTQPSRSFDVREYTHGVQELATTLEQMNLMLKSSDELLAKPEWEQRIRQLSDSADGRMAMAVEQSRVVTNRMFLRLYIAMGVLFALLIVYRVISHLLARRLRLVLTTPPYSSSGNGDSARATSRLQTSTSPTQRTEARS